MAEPVLRRVERRDAAAREQELQLFVHEHYPRLIRLAALVCHRISDAEDAVQAALERAWRSRMSLRDGDNLKPWLDRIVVREAIRIDRHPVRTLVRMLLPGDDAIAAPAAMPDRPDPDRVALEAAIDRLPADQRAAVALHLYAGYTVEETAGIVQAPVETVRSRLRLARGRLRAELRNSP